MLSRGRWKWKSRLRETDRRTRRPPTRGRERWTTDVGRRYFGVSFNSLLVGGVFGLTVGVPLSVRT
jgi:hypothetical protein